MKKRYRFSWAWCAAMLLAFTANARIYYVNVRASGNNDGTSWDNAFTDLQSALDVAVNYDLILVAAGTYKPTRDIYGNATPADPRTKTFLLKNGAQVYGGFAGYEPASLSLRNPVANKTILSGDLNGNDGDNFSYNNENVYHVVSANSITSATLLDGFTVTAGNANGTASFLGKNYGDAYGGGLFSAQVNANLNIERCTFTRNYALLGGGGMNHHYSNATITDCIFDGNATKQEGGAIYMEYSSNAITNSIFSGNHATNGGAMVLYIGANPVVSNSTFTKNQAAQNGGVVNLFGSNSNLVLKNSIVWDNVSGGSGIVIYGNCTAAVTYSDIEGGYAGAGNINAAPLFRSVADPDGADNAWRTADDGLILPAASPAANTGSNAAVPAGVTTDILGDARVQNTTVNMGAYESFSVTTIYYVNAHATGSNMGTSWENAFTDLQSALDLAESGAQIWVAAGVYKPSKDITGNASPADTRNKTFLIKNGVKLYGGFGGHESALNERKNIADITILSGDLNGDDPVNSDENVYHVTAAYGISTATVLDGFTITAGKANSATDFMWTDNGRGAGLFSYGAGTKLDITRCIFRGNYSIFDGAAMWLDISHATVAGCIFADNNTQASYGGAIAMQSSSPRINNVVFHNNSSLYRGSAIYIHYSYPVISNSTFVNNHTLMEGSAIQSDNDSRAAVRNTILWGNGAGPAIGSPTGNAIAVSYSNVQGGYPGTGNINADPVFSDTTNLEGPDGLWRTDDDGLVLRRISPSANTGNNALVPADLSTDILGNARILDGTVNMGAYEAINHSVFYVKAGASGNNNGSSWTHAFTDLQSAIDVATSGDHILVAAGIYKPTKDITGNASPSDNRTKTFVIRNGVKLYGGYTGNESVPNERDVIHYNTILSGDLNGDDNSFSNNAENAYHVIAAGYITQATTIDGFTVTAGNANVTEDFMGVSLGHQFGGGLISNYVTDSLVITQCIFKGNYAGFGGGAMLQQLSSATVTDCVFSRNASSNYAGAIYFYQSLSAVTNCVFTGNTANYGGAMYVFHGSYPFVTNCTFAGNNAPYEGGAVYNRHDSNPEFKNTIFWGNTSEGPKSIVNEKGGVSFVTYSDVQGGYSGTGNVDVAPAFNDIEDPDGPDDLWRTADDGLTIGASSPVANAGSNAAIPHYITADIIGNDRIAGTTVDMGAYERTLTATITLSMTDVTYDGTTKSVVATTYPAGLNTIMRYEKDGLIVNPVDAGEYNVTATIDDAAYTGRTSGVLTIAKAQATVTLSGLSQVYDGTAKTITVTTEPQNLTGIAIAYMQNENPVTNAVNAGTYNVTAELRNPNYQAPVRTGTLVIARANQTITFNTLAPHTIDETGFFLNATASSGLSVSYSSSNTAVASVFGRVATINGPGSTTITAYQPGNMNYNAAANVSQILTVYEDPLSLTPGSPEEMTMARKGQTLEVYPNTVNDHVMVESKMPLNEESFDLRDAQGMPQFIPLPSQQSDSQYKLDLSGLRKGIYYLRIHTGEEIMTTRIIKN